MSFFLGFSNTPAAEEVAKEIDGLANGETSRPNATTGDRVEADENAVVGRRENAQSLKAIFLGTPSPTNALLSWATFAFNMLLAAMALDMIYRAPVFYPSHDVSFARVGYVSDTSARILIREPNIAALPVEVSYRREDPKPFTTASVLRPLDDSWKTAYPLVTALSKDTDFTTTILINGLSPDTRYRYALSTNHTGYFVTAPRPGQVSKRPSYEATFTFLHSSCIKPRVPYSPFSHPLEIPGFKHLAALLPRLHASFMLFLGDFIYIDVPTRIGSTVEDYRREYRQMYASGDWPSVSSDLPWVHVYDDHEIANDWDKTIQDPYPAAFDPYMHYQIAPNPPPVHKNANTTYFSFTHGPAAFFLMDTRRYRSPEFDPRDASHPEKTMLGKQQLRDLLAWLHEPVPSGVRWKFVVSSIPFTKNWRFGSEDTWGGYLHERQIILEAMWDVSSTGSHSITYGGRREGVGVVVLSGDRHEFAATAFPPPLNGAWPQTATVHEFSTSPLSMFYLPVRTYWQADDEDVSIK